MRTCRARECKQTSQVNLTCELNNLVVNLQGTHKSHAWDCKLVTSTVPVEVNVDGRLVEVNVDGRLVEMDVDDRLVLVEVEVDVNGRFVEVDMDGRLVEVDQGATVDRSCISKYIFVMPCPDNITIN